MICSLEEAEHAVQSVFEKEFPHQNFAQWNTTVPDADGNRIIKNVGKAMTINVRRFIQDLS